MWKDKKEIEIIFENDSFLVVNKPAGVVTTREKNKLIMGTKYLEDWVASFFSIDLPRQGIVHRLDKGTSGLVIIAKTRLAWENLKMQFKNRITKKTYLALVEGDFPGDMEINMPIKRSNFGFEKFGVHEDGKEAITLAKTRQKYRKDGKIYSLVEVGLKTGRTHQIRVHLSYLKWPIVGDKVYGSKIELGRPFLHAWKLELDNPETGKRMSFVLDLPKELVVFLNGYENLE